MADNLQKHMLSGMVWTFARQFSMQAFAFVEGIILARMLQPSDYGLITMTTIFFAISGCFIDSGFATALIKKKDRTEIDYSTVFVTNVCLTAFFSTLLCLCSPLIANFYGEPILVKIVCANSLLLFLNSFFTIQNTRLSITLQFKAQNIIRVITNVTVGIVTIIMAIMGYGVWALIWPNFLQPILNGIQYWKVQHWFPRIKFSWKSWREFFAFGSNILVTNLITTVYDNIYPLVVGKKFSATSLGYYSKAQRYADLPAYTLRTVLGPVAFPVLSTIQDDDQRLGTSYRRLISLSGYLVFPLLVGLAAIANPFILILITEKWQSSVVYLQILCFAFMWTPIQMLNLDLMKVKGRSDLLLKLEIIKKILGISILIISIPFGLIYMCVGQVITALISVTINTYYTSKLLKVGFSNQLNDLLPSFLYATTMGIIVYLCTLVIKNLWLQMLVGVTVGACYYYFISVITKSADLVYLKMLVKTHLLKK